MTSSQITPQNCDCLKDMFPDRQHSKRLLRGSWNACGIVSELRKGVPFIRRIMEEDF